MMTGECGNTSSKRWVRGGRVQGPGEKKTRNPRQLYLPAFWGYRALKPEKNGSVIRPWRTFFWLGLVKKGKKKSTREKM